jgi:hypothetical protein
MKTISNLYDGLRPYGINPLIAEACPYSQRVLCDLTPRGKKIVFDLLGIPPAIPLSENWNSGSSFSMMLPRSLLSHDLPIWCLIDSGCDDIIVSSDGICGRQADDSDEDWENEDCRHPGIRRFPLEITTPAFHWLTEGWVNHDAHSGNR